MAEIDYDSDSGDEFILESSVPPAKKSKGTVILGGTKNFKERERLQRLIYLLDLTITNH